MDKKPVIGLTASFDHGKSDVRGGEYNVSQAIVNAVVRAGGIPVVLPMYGNPEDAAYEAELFDGYIFTGGDDPAPSLYGEDTVDVTVKTEAARDASEFPLFRAILAQDKPVLGICRGNQVSCVALGGTLWQDLPSQFPSEIAHRQVDRLFDKVHEVRVMPGTPLCEIAGEKLGVNSSHHQAIRTIPPGAVKMAEAPDGVIESYYMPGKKFCWGIQWHPERLQFFDGVSRSIFERFIDACRNQ